MAGMEKVIIQRSKSAQVQPWKPDPKFLVGKDKARQRVWDCGSSLYDSVELDSLKRRLNSACHSRSLSLPHLAEQPQPPPPPKRGGSRISRSLKKLVRSVFFRGKLKSGEAAVVVGKGNALPQMAESESESERYMARSVSKHSLWTCWARRNLLTCDNVWESGSKSGSSWLWRCLVTIKNGFLQIHSGAVPPNLCKSSNSTKMNTGMVYSSFAGVGLALDWCSVIWGGRQAKKWSFICWLATKRRLPTASKLFSWGMIDSPLCPLCKCCDEDEDHIWFQCAVTKEVLEKVLVWQNVGCRWYSLDAWWCWFGSSQRRKNNIYLSRLMAITSLVYFIWSWKNKVVFQGASFDSNNVANEIISTCKFRCIHKLNVNGRRGNALLRRLV